MYNRYIPQHDGTYCRRSVPEPQKEQPRPKQPEKPQNPPPKPVPLPPIPCQNCMSNPHRRSVPKKAESTVSIGSFLKQLLPKDFGTEDLLIVLMLLLMAGDSPEDQNSALLTLALYLFL